MAYELKEINARIKSDAAGFLKESDAKYTAKVENAAERIAANRDKSPIVLLSGPSGSGKTTTALKIEEALKKRGINCHTVSMDNYFKSVDFETAPKTPTGAIDYESPACLDMDLLNNHFVKLAQGEEIHIPKFEFSRQMRNDARALPLRLGSSDVAIFEGIHALNDEIARPAPGGLQALYQRAVRLHGPGHVCFKRTWLRLVRRVVRDYNFRGSDVSFTLSMWDNVRRGEKLYISPYKNRADIMFDSALPYEVSVMKHYAIPLFEKLPEQNQRKAELQELGAAFRQFEEADPALVPKDSLLREFIGGGSYTY
jgi:uridine kinase